MKKIVSILCFVALTQILQAAGLPTGTWVRRAIKDGRKVTMTIESAGAGRTITHKVELPDGRIRTIVFATRGDGRDAPVMVDGKPSEIGHTNAFTTVDDRHCVNVSKLKGEQVSKQKWEFAADGNVITIETISGAPEARSVVDHWDKK